jgi:uncharacterized membrane protein YfcA
MPDLISLAPWIAFTFFLAGLVKGVAGMGLPSVVMGLLALVMAPVHAAALLIVPSLATNLWQMLAGPAFFVVLRRLALMLVGSCVGIAFGIDLITGAGSRLSSILLGSVLAAYGVLAFMKPQFGVPRCAEPWISPVVGVTTGVLAGGTGVFVVPAVPYMSALKFSREELIQALGMSFTASTLAMGVALSWKSSYPALLMQWSVAAVLPVATGMWAGQRIRHRLNAETFRRCFFMAMIALGALMVARAW